MHACLYLTGMPVPAPAPIKENAVSRERRGRAQMSRLFVTKWLCVCAPGIVLSAGYIIGLGDRHLHNILLDTRSAEVVHIDLGIAFEQGRFLNTPELVPFRLTRDIVDGMGATGVEGVMRRSCEETLRVLRTNADSLLTIIEARLLWHNATQQRTDAEGPPAVRMQTVCMMRPPEQRLFA
jgi:Phosphatidylinositol 3- and 4-kinase